MAKSDKITHIISVNVLAEMLNQFLNQTYKTGKRNHVDVI